MTQEEGISSSSSTKGKTKYKFKVCAKSFFKKHDEFSTKEIKEEARISGGGVNFIGAISS